MKMLVICLLIVCIISQAAAGAGAYDGYHHDHDHHHKSSSSAVVIRLTHHHSVLSPTYNLNHSQTMTDRANFDFHSSLQRAAAIYSRSSLYYLGSGLTALNGAGFVAHVEVGSQSMKQNVLMDTGSGLLWIHCMPCRIERAPDPIFSPRQSSSYGLADCRVSQACRYPGALKVSCEHDNPIEKDNFCKYYGGYGDGKFISGRLSVENFKFENNTQVLHGIVFGCTRETDFYDANGVLGLSRTSLSILKQEGYSKFSYCIADVGDVSYPHNKLILGDIWNTSLASETPLISGNDLHYYINLEAIYIANYKLDFDPAITRRNPDVYTGGMIVDSGATYTFLTHEVYDKLEEAVVAELDHEISDYVDKRNYGFTYRGVTRLCYDGVFTADLTLFPTVRFQFEGGAVMRFDTKNLFQQVTEKSFCLAVLPPPQNLQESKISILGILMQQFYYVGFDLDTDKFVFQQYADCSLIG